ncbi:hypothetical protein SEVIR_1G052633v4 [Setaria viridis]|uniref:uncharacterized protein LOC101758682 n=1 Tax=Setaria italica TaxID=4555 RepID=UPI0003509F8A|nr:uncharacterized protein LOC101758682 [Setaria italica]XP_022682925.1 uncharacterized protein LOC101758682 [Setaria italica]XP_022682929.1 uncharacterized protein LOC101758682 [Setaria italica]XP_034600411.1 uncharacterized protein LOC117861049 [Setaria viridis]XP_034600418.1 uncharacterized protein LOC117861049 [Setaria viridis]
MGSAVSCIDAPSVSGDVQQPARPPAPPSRVIAADGSLKELPGPQLPTVSDVLSSSGGASPSFFVCNSDALYFDERPPALAAAERLRPGQMYFVLPVAMLGRPLSSADMAALAARAIAALPAEEPRGRAGEKRKRKQVRVVPVLLREDGEGGVDESVFHETLNEKTLGELAAATSQARGGDKVAAAATGKTRPSALKRALSMIREDAE